MPHIDKRSIAAKRVKPTKTTWQKILQRAGDRCEWSEAGQVCGLANGDVDPIGGGTVRLTPDHRRPHSIDPDADPGNARQWQALCGRHQVIKKNYWHSLSGKLNVYAIVQAASRGEKWDAFVFLLNHFGYDMMGDGTVAKREGTK